MGQLFWKVNLSKKDAVEIFCKTHEFWLGVLESWFDLTYCENSENVYDQILWYNSQLRIGDEPIFDGKCFENGLVYVKDMLKGDSCLTWHEFSVKFNSKNFLLYQGIVNNVKKLIAKKEMQMQTRRNWLGDLMLIGKPVKVIYRAKITNTELVSKTLSKINKVLEEPIMYEDLLKCIKNIKAITISTKLRSFQYRMLQSAIITNVQLFRFNMTTSNLCSFCSSEAENIVHLFVECPKVRNLWSHLAQKYQIETDRDSILLN